MSLDNSVGQIGGLHHIRLPERPRNEYGWVLFFGDLLAVLVAWYIANQIFFAIPIPTTFVGPRHLPVIEILSIQRLVVIIAVLILLRQNGHYKDRIHYFFQLRSIFLACTFGLIGESVLRLYLDAPTSTSGLIIAWGLMAFFVMCFRVATANYICSKARFLQPVIVLSDGPLGQHAKKAIARKPRLGYRNATPQEAGDLSNASSMIRTTLATDDSAGFMELQRASKSANSQALLLYAFDEFDDASVVRTVRTLEALNHPIGFITCQTGIRLPCFKEFPFFGEDLILLLPDQREIPVLTKLTMRAFDIVLATLLLIVLAPVLATFAFMISRDGGPVTFSHGRMGKSGSLFRCLKFRTMVQDADVKLAEYLETNPAAQLEWEQDHKLRKDPRITRIGRFLRKSSLDEAAQLINIILGEMSFVGPRPIVREEIEKYGPTYTDYCEVRPGITGLWQVSGRNNTTYDERVELDKWYVTNRSLWLDIFILVKTVPVVLLRRGAF